MVAILALAVIAIIAIIILGPYSGNNDNDNRDPGQPQHTVVPIIPSEDDYINRGLKPNVAKPDEPVVPDTVKVQPTPPEPDTAAIVHDEKILYVGRADWHVYHHLRCKYARRIERDNLVAFSSANAARAAGYVPCKICRPPAGEVAQEPLYAQTPSQPIHKPPPHRKPRPRRKPQPVKFRTVPIDFPYKVIEREMDNYEGILRVDYTVEVESVLKRDKALSLAKKLVKEETSRQAVNAISFVIRRKVKGPRTAKWLIWIDWAPYGSITQAGLTAPGNYHAHQFQVILEGIQ